MMVTDFWGGRLPNIHYTERKALLLTLHERLLHERSVALCGLGGMGKSELCIHYLMTYAKHYQAIIWLDASSKETMSKELALMHKVAPSLTPKFTENEKTLLILDNIRDLSLVPLWRGYLIFTTRFAQSRFPLLVIPPLSLEESTLLLLRRSRIISHQGSLEEASTSERAVAAEIAKEIEGYPLALEQTGVQLLSWSPSQYLSHFRSQPTRLLASRIQSSPSQEEPSLVDIIRETVRDLSPRGKKLLRTLASLPPDAVCWPPGPKDQQSVNELLDIFLIARDETIKLSMHRLVRTIILGK